VKVKLGDVIQLNPSEKLPKGERARKIAMDNLDTYAREISGFDFDEYKGGTKFRNEDTLLARITPCLENGKTAYVNILEKDEVAFGSTEYFVLRANKELINPLYLYYLSVSSDFRTVAIKSMTGTSGRQRVQKEAILNYEFDLPSLKEQERIVSRIECLDDKKALNDRINDNLDLLLTTIFENKINNKNFTKAHLTDIATYRNGLAMQKFRPDDNEQSLPVLKIKELNQGYIDDSSDRCSAEIDESVVVNTGDIIFSWSGTLLVKNWAGETAGLNQHLFKVTSNNYPEWFIYEWTKHHLQKFQSIAAGKATTMGHIKRSDLKSSEVLVPNNDELDKLNTIMKPIYDKRIEVINENQRLIGIKRILLQRYF